MRAILERVNNLKNHETNIMTLILYSTNIFDLNQCNVLMLTNL